MVFQMGFGQFTRELQKIKKTMSMMKDQQRLISKSQTKKRYHLNLFSTKLKIIELRKRKLPCRFRMKMEESNISYLRESLWMSSTLLITSVRAFLIYFGTTKATLLRQTVMENYLDPQNWNTCVILHSKNQTEPLSDLASDIQCLLTQLWTENNDTKYFVAAKSS